MSAPDHRGPAGRQVRWLLALVLALLALPLAAPSAHAAATGVRVVLTAVSTNGGEPTSTVRVAGTLTNTSGGPLYGVTVSIVRNNDRLRTLTVINEALAATDAPPTTVFGQRPGQSQVVTTPAVALPPGGSADFVVSGTLGDLDLAANSSYWVGARATAATSAGGDPTAAAGQALSLATVPGTDAPTVVSLVDLSTTPSRLRANLFIDDRLAAELATGGRLRRLVDLAGTAGYSWVVDPSLVAEATDMADGYKVLNGDAAVDGTGVQAAADWLAAFRALPPAAGALTLYGSPDLAGSLQAGSSVTLGATLAATTASGLNFPVIATPRRVSAALLSDLGRRGVPVISPAVPAAHAWTTMGGAKVAAATTFSGLPTSAVLGDTTMSRAAIALALTRATGLQVRLLTSPDDQVLDAAASPSWVVRTPLAVVTGTPPTTTAETVTTPGAPGALTPALVRRIDRLWSDLKAYGSAAPRSGVVGLSDALTANASSEAWLDDPAGRLAYLDQLDRRTGAGAIRTGISVTATPNITMSSATNQFPATVTNHLPDSITVRVVGVSDNGARLSVQPSDWVTIRPNDSFTVQLTASAGANGSVGVRLHAETRDGTTVSSVAPVTIEATNLGQVGWIIIAVSGAVLAVTTALRIRQVRRRMAG